MDRKPRIAHLAGPNATIQNTPPLVALEISIIRGVAISTLIPTTHNLVLSAPGSKALFLS